MNKKVLLCILDGRGLSDDMEASAILQAKTPNFDRLWEVYPHTKLQAHGSAVGLPEEQMGNSEVGHMHLGAGRILPQNLVKISQDLSSHERRSSQLLEKHLAELEDGSTVHLIGLCSDGGVHSHLEHLVLLLERIKTISSIRIMLHLMSDGRDVSPTSFLGYLAQLTPLLDGERVRIGTVMGRYRAMDRDCRRERIQKAYDAIVKGEGNVVSDIAMTVERYYLEGVTDEFLEPIIVSGYEGFAPGDSLYFRNFRTDRMRQLVYAMTQSHDELPDMPSVSYAQLLTMTMYDETFSGCTVLFPQEDIVHTLGEMIADAGKTQLRAAETEKYPHVTYFFSGGREEAFSGENRLLVKSPNVTTYDLQPEMSAGELTVQTIRKIKTTQPDFICLNYANPDMVGHTGDMNAVIQAVETVDVCLGKLIETAQEYGYDVCILADHGNAECMVTEDGSPHTAHTCNPVPCIVITTEKKKIPLHGGDLTDVAPWILSRLGIAIPVVMQHPNVLIDTPTK